MRLAAVEDIAAMKLSAIAGRCSRKDFVDVYFISREVMALREALRCLDEKFAGVPYERYHVLKSLTYFDDAESQPMPDMERMVQWPEVKRFRLSEARVLFLEER